MPKEPRGRRRPAGVAGRAVPVPEIATGDLDDLDTVCVFDGVVTLDPEDVLRAWDRLTQDTWVLEIQEIPRIMHVAFVNTLKERGGMKHGK